MCLNGEGCEYVQANVPTEAIRKARKGSVRPRMAGYRFPAAHSPMEPAARPLAPPTAPPLSVSLQWRKWTGENTLAWLNFCRSRDGNLLDDMLYL